MIKGNALEVFSALFENGEKFFLMAKDKDSARLLAIELNHRSPLLKVERVDGWFDND